MGAALDASFGRPEGGLNTYVPGRKTDVADAQWLATLARAGLLRASFIPPVQMRQLRLVARQRQKALDTEQFSAAHHFVAHEIMEHIEHIEQRIARLDAYLLEGLKSWQPQLTLLQTIPGIDEQGAAKLLVEIGTDMDAFGSAERLASWVGICPGNNESAGKRKTGRIRKGNAWVRRLLCEFAQAAARTRCALKARFDALSIRKGRKKSVVALAHKMLRTVYAMLANGTHYQDKEVDYEALNVQRNAPRWLKMLRKHGFIATPAAA
jgi:transposase